MADRPHPAFARKVAGIDDTHGDSPAFAGNQTSASCHVAAPLRVQGDIGFCGCPQNRWIKPMQGYSF